MELPVILREELEKRTSSLSPTAMKEAASGISQRYRNESGKGKRLITNMQQSLTYCAVRMPATYCSVRRALELSLECFDSPVSSLLDVGAGTGAAAWAADSLLELSTVKCIERETAMSALGREMMSAGSMALKSSEWISSDIRTMSSSISADLVIASYVLNELSENERTDCLKKLWYAADKMLLIVEPGTPEGFRQLRYARDTLLSIGAHIAAPCTHEKPCRLGNDDWCHFTVRVARSRLHKYLKGGDAPFEDEKFSFMTFVHNELTKPEMRILRHPSVGKGRIGLSVCTPEENKSIMITKSSGESFKKARKLSCGDSFEI